jgi:Carboxypeptidase regulatory-like domain
MKLIATLVGYLVATTLLFLLGIVGTAWAGGSNDEGPDDHQDAGLSYFGFVKDTTGKVIADAKVTAEIKGLGSVIARTNATGAYRLPGFGKDVSPKNVSISCSKDGYKQTRTFTRTALNKKPLTAIEIECTMQRVAAK